jgi:hypothetical protein
MIFQRIILYLVKVLNKMKTVLRLLNKNIKHSFAKIFQRKAVVHTVINADSPTEIKN